MYCIKCGAHLPAEARYCWRCGYRAPQVTGPEPEAEPAAPNPQSGELRWEPATPSTGWQHSAAPASGTARTAPVGALARSGWQYKSASGLATAIAVLAAFTALGFGLDAFLGLALVVNPRTTTYDALGVGTFIGFVAAIPMVIVYLIWTRRVTGNLEPFGVARSWGTGWAIGAWFIPLASWLLPMFVINQAYKAADPALTPPVGDQWRSRPSSPLFWTWWVLWIVGNFLSSVPLSLVERDRVLSDERLTEIGWVFFFCYGILTTAAVLGAICVRELTLRQDAFARRWLQMPT
ncbi:MAG: DUF4328 domain-containing protein [Chloroflexota bacterium]|nr:DUF4328 domain-containing protein [Dehalococcoidia bacterium]MDW8047178.1 DUF4328 domain-containing protein [Chloroflexota bacterium]